MNFLHLTLVEMRRAIHRRVVWWMNALALLGCAFTGFVVYVSSANPDFGVLEPSHPANMVTWTFENPNGGFLGVAAAFLAIGAAICGASVAGAEWKNGTITTVLTWAPSRWRLHLARTTSAAIWSFVIGFALQVVFLAACLPAVLANGSTDVNDDFWTQLLLGMLRICVTTSLVAVLALSIATIGRNTAPALVGLAIWALILENLVRGLRPKWAPHLITENVGTFVSWERLEDVDFSRGPATALAALLFYLAVFVTFALLSFIRRDIAGTS